jgi:hypothetical protein
MVVERPKKEKEVSQPITLRIRSDKRLYCNQCNSELLKDHSCGKCGIFYQPEQARHQLVIKGMDGKEPGPYVHQQRMPIASIDTMPSRKPQKMGEDFEALKKAGYNFTSYSESNV